VGPQDPKEVTQGIARDLTGLVGDHDYTGIAHDIPTTARTPNSPHDGNRGSGGQKGSRGRKKNYGAGAAPVLVE
jgi:hypothetical protein